MAIDVDLVLDSGEVVTADKNTDYIVCEGGFLAWAHMYWGVMSGGGTTLDARVMYSPDNGSNYYMAPGGKFRQVGPTDDSKEDRIPVYIPRPTKAGDPVRVRLNLDVAGSSPSYAITTAMLEPMTSLAPPAIDEQLLTGVALRIAGL